jgi:hypothetical protein
MTTLLLPVAGKSSRFPGMRPKWLLTMPDGRLMIEKSIEGIRLECFNKIVIICLKEHLEAYLSKEGMEQIAQGIDSSRVSYCILQSPTKSQSETVRVAIEMLRIEGPIFIKDCDNYFKFEYQGGNEIATLDLHNIELVDAKNKSYVSLDALGRVTNIAEKSVISNKFCVGGYGFESAREFANYYDELGSSENELYVSHVIYSMILTGKLFHAKEVSEYIDWGTLREYRHYQKKYITIFCDVDGVLLENGSKFGPVGWRTPPLLENLKSLKKLKDLGQLYLIITTSRPKSERGYLEKIFHEQGLYPDDYVMGLPHTARVLVNDYSSTNPYPTSIAINLQRNSDELSNLIGIVENV